MLFQNNNKYYSIYIILQYMNNTKITLNQVEKKNLLKYLPHYFIVWFKKERERKKEKEKYYEGMYSFNNTFSNLIESLYNLEDYKRCIQLIIIGSWINFQLWMDGW